MTIVVSISQFRQRVADYIEKAKEGHTVILRDEKKDEEVVQLVSRKEFDPDSFGRALKNASGVFTAENHPEWRTKKDVVNWLTKERLKSDRKF